MSLGAPSASPSLRAALYASLHTGTPGDLDYYARACAGAKSILELGCGTGRILETLPHDARRVGLDIDAQLLRLARSPLDLVHADMRAFRFDQRFDRILLPYTTLYCLSDDDEVRACFERVREHLAEGGRLLFDAYCADSLHFERGTGRPDDPDEEDVAVIEVEGVTYHVREESTWDAARQCLDVVYVYEPRSGGHSIADSIRHHYLLLDQIEPLLHDAGLELLTLESAFDGSAVDAETDHYVVTARVR